MQTELTVVNSLLQVIGESPINEVDRSNPDVLADLTFWLMSCRDYQPFPERFECKDCIMKVHIPKTSQIDKQIFNCDGKRWFISRLIENAKELPVQTMPLSALNLYRLAPHIDSMKSFVGHIQGVLDVDLSYPIILDEEGYVMDGRHRIAKALLEGQETISFVRFDETPQPDYFEKDE
jgi:hypothetical protein